MVQIIPSILLAVAEELDYHLDLVDRVLVAAVEIQGTRQTIDQHQE
jgi:hypothetical protein